MKGIIAMFLTAASLFSLTACRADKPIEQTEKSNAGIYCGAEALDEQQTVPALAAGDEMLLSYNPDRGFRTEIAFHMYADYSPQSEGLMNEFEYEIVRHLEIFAGTNPRLSQVYVYLYDYNDVEQLPQSVLDRLELIFEALRKYEIKALLRFAYQIKVLPEEEATQEIMCAHMEQLFPVVEKNLDVIHVYQAGFLGAWGEWHGYTLNINRKKLLESIMENCPEELFVQVRLPKFKNAVSADAPYWDRISYHNDSVFGEAQEATGGVDPGTESERQVEAESPCLPIDGELFWGEWSEDAENGGYYPDPFKVIYWLYDHRFTSFSLMHNNFEFGVRGTKFAMQQWRNIELTPEKLDEMGMIYDPDYFASERSVYEYIRDHLGYRIKASELDLAVKDGGVSVRMNFENYGFAAPHMIKDAGFALLNMNGKMVSEAAFDGINTWQPRSVTGEKEVLEHSATAELSAGPGTYYLVFYARNDSGTPVRLCNELVYDGGYNILGTVEIA